MATDDKGRPRTKSTGIIPGQFQGSRPEEHTRLLLGRRPTVAPANPPTNFPGDLWPQTNLILLKARKKFPLQMQILELCKRIISDMTPLFCQEVKAGKMKADAVQRENGGGMEDLLHSLFVYNDYGPYTGFGLSDTTFQLGKKVRQSHEWLALAKAIAKAQRNTTGVGRLRTGEKQAESPHAQNSEGKKPSEVKPASPHELVEDYIQEVLAKTGKRITKKEIWTAAGYNSRTEFERWERQDGKRPNSAAHETFTRMLTVEKPHLKK
jgi:hypothetical protein